MKTFIQNTLSAFGLGLNIALFLLPFLLASYAFRYVIGDDFSVIGDLVILVSVIFLGSIFVGGLSVLSSSNAP